MGETFVGLNEVGKNNFLTNADEWVSDIQELSTFPCHFFNAENIDKDIFNFKEHKIVFEAWIKAKGDALMPMAEQLDPLKMFGSLGYLLILEPQMNNGVQDFFYRLYGTHIVKGYGQDMTGKFISDFTTEPGKAFAVQYSELLNQKRPFYAEHNAAKEV